MRYSLKLQQKILEESSSKTPEELAEEYNLPVSLVNKWLVLNLSEEELKYSVRQKFYNTIPLLEAKIENTYSDFIVCGITDKEWDQCCKTISQLIIDFAYKIYKTAISDPILNEKEIRHHRKEKKDE